MIWFQFPSGTFSPCPPVEYSIQHSTAGATIALTKIDTVLEHSVNGVIQLSEHSFLLCHLHFNKSQNMSSCTELYQVELTTCSYQMQRGNHNMQFLQCIHIWFGYIFRFLHVKQGYSATLKMNSLQNLCYNQHSISILSFCKLSCGERFYVRMLASFNLRDSTMYSQQKYGMYAYFFVISLSLHLEVSANHI